MIETADYDYDYEKRAGTARISYRVREIICRVQPTI